MLSPMQSPTEQTPLGKVPPHIVVSSTLSPEQIALVVEHDRQSREAVNAAVAEAKRQGVPLSDILPVH